MARKKTAKTAKAKKTVKRQTKLATTSLVDKMEQSFKGMPGQLVAQCRKDLATLQQQEKKLTAEFKKALALSKAINSKCVALSKAKMTAQVKKQLLAAKQGHAKANQAIKAMTSKIEHLKQQIETLMNKQARFVALDKELGKFDKQWHASIKKKVKSSKKSTKRVAKVTTTYTPPVQEQPEITIHDRVETEVESLEPVDTTTY